MDGPRGSTSRNDRSHGADWSTCTFASRCTQPWEAMRSVQGDDVRFCDTCSKPVYTTHTPDEFLTLAAQDRCVRIPPRIQSDGRPIGPGHGTPALHQD